MSSRVFQSVIVQMKEATDRMIGVIDADANVISCSDTSMIGEKWPEAVIRLNSAPDSIVAPPCPANFFVFFSRDGVSPC